MKHAFALALLVLCGAAPASADTMDSTFGNTVRVTLPSGVVERYYFEPTGAFSMVSEDGRTRNGQWRREGEEVCFIVDGAAPDCNPVPTDKNVGDSWALETGGGAITITIVEGR